MQKTGYIITAIFFIISCRPAKKVQRIEEAISKKDTAQTVIVEPEKKLILFC